MTLLTSLLISSFDLAADSPHEGAYGASGCELVGQFALAHRCYLGPAQLADCFKYAEKVGAEVGPTALAASVASNKYNCQRLLRFAEICRVKQAVAAAEKERRQPNPVDSPAGEEVPKPGRIWDRDLLEKQVWSDPIRRLAKKYDVSDVAIHKHCKKMGISLPGRGYWAKWASQQKP